MNLVFYLFGGFRVCAFMCRAPSTRGVPSLHVTRAYSTEQVGVLQYVHGIATPSQAVVPCMWAHHCPVLFRATTLL